MKIKEQIIEVDSIVFEESMISDLEKNMFVLKQQKKEMEENKIIISGKLNSLSLKNEENESLRERLNHIEICPTCLQNVDPVYKSNVLNKLESETLENGRQNQSLTLELEQVNKKFYDLETEINEKQKQIQEFEIIKIKLKEVDEKKKRIFELEDLNESVGRDLVEF